MSRPIHPRFSRNYLNKAFQMILNLTQQTLNAKNRVITLTQPKQLHQKIDLKLSQQPTSDDKLLQTVQKILQQSVKPYHPNFHNTLFGGFDQYAVSGAMMTPFLNGNMYTYQMASCFTLMENQVYQHFRKVLNWQKIDGIMAPGGSFGNFIAIHSARFHKFPQVKQKGIQGIKGDLKIMVSDVSHYSIKKGANLAGMGTNSIVNINTDKTGRMNPQDLDKKIQNQINKGNKPFMVVSTIGTTVQGAIDNVQQISKVCQKYKIWLHLDAAFGGVFFASKQLRNKIGDCSNVDSVVWDPHKGLLVPLQACVVLMKHPGLMQDCNSTVADYLFHKQRQSYDNCLDTGNKSLQCGRILDILKLWTYFKANGWSGINQQVVLQYNLAQYVRNYCITRPQKFKLAIQQVDSLNVCFWYLPQKLKLDFNENSQQYWQMINDCTVLAKKFMIDQGKILIGYSSTKGSKYFWRTVMSNPYTLQSDIDLQMNLIAEYCQRAYGQLINRKK